MADGLGHRTGGSGWAPTPGRRPRISAVVVSYNTRALLRDALASLAPLAELEIVVVDNASTDGSAAMVAREFPAARLIQSTTNGGFAAGVNLGVQASRGAYLLLLNPDARLPGDALGQLAGLLDARPGAAAAGAALAFGDGRPQASAFRFPGLAQLVLDLFPVRRLQATRLNGRYAPASRSIQVDHPLGACMLVRRSAWDDVGPFDEGYFMYVEEVDWCRRARARGWEVWHVPGAVAVHHGGQATRQQADAMFAQLWRSRLRYYERYHGPLYTRLVRLLVRWGMRAEAARARRRLSGPPLAGRLAAVRAVQELAA